MSSKKPRLQVVPEGKPATPTEITQTANEIAQVEFRALKVFRKMSATQRVTKVHDIVDQVRPMAVLASEILAKTKPELVALVDEQYETWGPFLMQLANATKETRMLMDVIHAAECRLAVTLANIESPQMFEAEA